MLIPDSRAGRQEEALGHNLPQTQGQPPGRHEPSPVETARHRQKLALIVGLMLVIFAANVLLPRNLIWLTFYWLPLVLAGSLTRPRQILAVALTNAMLILVTGLRWSLLGDIPYLQRLIAMALVTPMIMVLVQQRQRGEKHLRASEMRFRLHAENATDVVFRANLDGVTEWISDTVTPLLGWRREQLVGQPFGSFVHPDDLPQLKTVDVAVARGERQQFRLRVRKAQGGYHWVGVNARGAVDGAGSVVGIVGSWRDIQKKVEAEQSAARDRSRLATTLDSLQDPHVVLEARRDTTGAIVDFVYINANQAACRYIRLSHQQLIGWSVLELLPAHSATGLLAMYIQVVETGEPLVLDNFVYPHDILGEERFFDIRAAAMGDELSFTWRDVGERHEAAERLAASEDSYRVFAQNASDVVLHIRDGTIVWASPSMTRALGWQPQECIDHPVADFIHPDDLAIQGTNAESVLRGQSVVFRFRIRAKDGILHWVEAHACPYLDGQGRIDGRVSSLRIIDRLVVAELQLQRYARTDELTGLLNRREVLEKIDARTTPVLRTGKQTAVLFCDLDHFKSINDRYGHAAGDQVLRVVAERIKGCLRSQDLAARLGGDELLVLLRGVQDLDNAVEIAERIQSVIKAPIPTPNGELQITLSIGVTLALRGEGSDALIARADAAMYEAKKTGRDRVIPISG